MAPNHNTPCHRLLSHPPQAAQNGHLEVCRELLRAGADVLRCSCSIPATGKSFSPAGALAAAVVVVALAAVFDCSYGLLQLWEMRLCMLR